MVLDWELSEMLVNNCLENLERKNEIEENVEVCFSGGKKNRNKWLEVSRYSGFCEFYEKGVAGGLRVLCRYLEGTARRGRRVQDQKGGRKTQRPVGNGEVIDP